MTAPDRNARALAALAAAGLPHATLRAAGHDAAVAVIGNLPPDSLPLLAGLAPALRDAGFRYVTLDISRLADA